MAIKNTFYIPLDKKQPGASKVEVVEDDTGNVIVITLTDAGLPVDLAGCQVLAVFSKPDGTIVQQDNNGHGVATAGNQITIDLYNGSFSPGTVNCEIEIYSTEDEPYDTLVTTAQFSFTCRRRIANQNTLPSQPSWPILEGALQELAGIKRGVQADYTQTDVENPAYIKNKPIVGTDLQEATQKQPSAEETVADTATVSFYDQTHKKVSWGQIKSWMSTALNPVFALFAPLTHKSRHAADGADALAPGDIGAAAETHAAQHASGGSDPIPLSTIGAAGLDADNKVLADQASAKIVIVPASETLGLNRSGKHLLANSNTNITITIPADASVAFPIGAEVEITDWIWGGRLTIAAASGTTIYWTDGAMGNRTSSNVGATCVGKHVQAGVWLFGGL